MAKYRPSASVLRRTLRELMSVWHELKLLSLPHEPNGQILKSERGTDCAHIEIVPQ